jgi:hypothetical protein
VHATFADSPFECWASDCPSKQRPQICFQMRVQALATNTHPIISYTERKRY